MAIIKTRRGYFLPGGGVDTGESDIDALKREILEETGCQASILTELGEAVEYIKAYSEKKHYQIRSRFYGVQLGSKVREGIEKGEQLVWLRKEDAVTLLKPGGQVWVVQRMLKG
ncbi:MAG: NUDIX domain-containing protein [Actinobacteria bacterium]|nr:NUDIX domain-containing protein [Actinomycetota bacterium]